MNEKRRKPDISRPDPRFSMHTKAAAVGIPAWAEAPAPNKEHIDLLVVRQNFLKIR